MDLGQNLRLVESRNKSEKKKKVHRWDLLYESGDLYEKKRELVSQIFRIEREKEDLKNCTFAPDLSK